MQHRWDCYDLTPSRADFIYFIFSFPVCARDPASFIQAYTCLPLPYAARQAAVVALQDMTETRALFALLMCGTKVLMLVLLNSASYDEYGGSFCKLR